MSIESAKAFVEKVKNDEEFRIKLGAAENKDERQAMAKAAGFDFTEEEWHIVTSQLSEEELSAVAGGWHGRRLGLYKVKHYGRRTDSD